MEAIYVITFGKLLSALSLRLLNLWLDPVWMIFMEQLQLVLVIYYILSKTPFRRYRDLEQFFVFLAPIVSSYQRASFILGPNDWWPLKIERVLLFRGILLWFQMINWQILSIDITSYIFANIKNRLNCHINWLTYKVSNTMFQTNSI